MLWIFVFRGAILEKSACPTDTLRHLNLVSRVLSYLFRLSLTGLSASSIFSVLWQILPAGVALGKTPMLTQFLVEQIEYIRSSATTPGSVKFRVWMSLDRLLQTDRTSEDRLRDKRRSLHATD